MRQLLFVCLMLCITPLTGIAQTTGGASAVDEIVSRIVQSDTPNYASPGIYAAQRDISLPVISPDTTFRTQSRRVNNYRAEVRDWERTISGLVASDDDVRALIRRGSRSAEPANRALETMDPAKPGAIRLALALRETGTRESIPVLVRLLKRATAPSDDYSVLFARQKTVMAATSALWKLTGRRFAQMPEDWETWWEGVADIFQPVRDRESRQVAQEDVRKLVSQLDKQELPAKERLIALGPNAIPHLLSALPEAGKTLQLRIAETVDEQGYARQLPRNLRIAYFAGRLVALKDSHIEEEWIAERALESQDLADFCRTAIEADRHGGEICGWVKTGEDSGFVQLFGDPNSPRIPKSGRTIQRRSDPEKEVMQAQRVLIAGLRDPDKAARRAAAEIAGTMGMAAPYVPNRLVAQLHKSWTTEQDDWLRGEIFYAMCRYGSPIVPQAIREGLVSKNEVMLANAADYIGPLIISDPENKGAVYDRLVELTFHPNNHVRFASVRSLRSWAPARLKPHLERLCKDSSESIREECAIAIPEMGDPALNKFLIQLSADENASVRQWAENALR